MVSTSKSSPCDVGSETELRQKFEAQEEANHRLRGSDGWHRQLFEENPHPMLVYDVSSLAILAVNAAAVREYGYPHAEFLAITLKRICSSAEVKALAEGATQPQGGPQEPGFWRHCRKDGTLFHARITSQAVQFAGRKARLALIRDIIGHRPTEPSLLRATEQWQTALDTADNAVWLIGPDYRIEQCNQAARTLFGKTQEEMISRHCWEIVHCTSEPIPNCPCRRMSLSRQREYTVLNLGARWYHVSVDPVLSPSGEIAGAIHTMLDITESKEIEAALRHSERIFRQLANAMPQLVWIADSAGVVNYYNDRVAEYFGAVRKTDGRWDWQLLVHPDDLGATLAAWQVASRAARRYTMQHRIRMADGSYRWHLSRALPVKDASGRAVKWFGTTTDIHDLEMVLEELHQTQQQLERRVAERTAELASTTDRLQKEMIERTAMQGEIFAAGERERERLGQDLHDGLCQLLTGIRCKTERLKEHLTARAPEVARSAQALCKLLTQAMREARGLARGLQPVARVPEGLMHGLLQLANSTCELFKVRCECRFPRPVLLHDHRVASELYRIAQEAVSNATRHGEPTLIRIGLRQTEHKLVLTVTNNGKPFRARTRGAGMGLKTMRVRAQHIGAALAITAARPGGTSVKCVLPISESVLRDTTSPVDSK